MTSISQHHRGHPPVQEIWVFGLADTSHTPALGKFRIWLLINYRRDMQVTWKLCHKEIQLATLLPIIQAHVANGTIIHSDQWAAYNRVASIPGVASHASVNHSINFVDPSTGVHTQNIESYWNRVSVVNALHHSSVS